MKNESPPLLQTEKLTKKIAQKTILNQVDFTIQTGQVKVIIGPSGSGKSTFLRCLNGLETIQNGTITYENQRIEGSDKKWRPLRQKIGMVFQNYELFPNLTVLENISLAPIKVQKRPMSEVHQQGLALLSRVGLTDFQDRYPRELSGGQKQRVAIIRALCMNPDLLLFDEVTASLDPEMVREVLEVIQTLAQQGRTMIIVTHEMNFARQVADEILFMDQGTIIESGSPELFFNQPQTERGKKFLMSFDF